MAQRRLAAFADTYLAHMLRQREMDKQAELTRETQRLADVRDDERASATQSNALAQQRQLADLTRGATESKGQQDAIDKLMADLTGASTSAQVPSWQSTFSRRLATGRPVTDLNEVTNLKSAVDSQAERLGGHEQMLRDQGIQAEAEKQRLEADNTVIDSVVRSSGGRPGFERLMGTLGQIQQGGGTRLPTFDPTPGQQPYNMVPIQQLTPTAGGGFQQSVVPWDPRNPPASVAAAPPQSSQEELRDWEQTIQELNALKQLAPQNAALLGPMASMAAEYAGKAEPTGATRRALEMFIGQPLTPEAFQFLITAATGRATKMRINIGSQQTAAEMRNIQQTYPNVADQPDKFSSDIETSLQTAITAANRLRQNAGLPLIPTVPAQPTVAPGTAPQGGAINRLRQR